VIKVAENAPATWGLSYIASDMEIRDLFFLSRVRCRVSTDERICSGFTECRLGGRGQFEFVSATFETDNRILERQVVEISCSSSP
jgi:hypothetical protein